MSEPRVRWPAALENHLAGPRPRSGRQLAGARLLEREPAPANHHRCVAWTGRSSRPGSCNAERPAVLFPFAPRVEERLFQRGCADGPRGRAGGVSEGACDVHSAQESAREWLQRSRNRRGHAGHPARDAAGARAQREGHRARPGGGRTARAARRAGREGGKRRRGPDGEPVAAGPATHRAGAARGAVPGGRRARRGAGAGSGAVRGADRRGHGQRPAAHRDLRADRRQAGPRPGAEGPHRGVPRGGSAVPAAARRRGRHPGADRRHGRAAGAPA